MTLPLGDGDKILSTYLETSKDSRIMQTSEELKVKVNNLNELFIQQGEDVFFKELPVEVLLLTERIKVDNGIGDDQ